MPGASRKMVGAKEGAAPGKGNSPITLRPGLLRPGTALTFCELLPSRVFSLKRGDSNTQRFTLILLQLGAKL